MKEYPSFEIPQEIWREKIVAFTSHAEGQRAVPILLLAGLKGRWDSQTYSSECGGGSRKTAIALLG